MGRQTRSSLRSSGLVPAVGRPRDVTRSGDVFTLLGGVRAGEVVVGTATARHVGGHGRRELAPLADLVAVQVEDDGDGHERGRHAAQ